MTSVIWALCSAVRWVKYLEPVVPGFSGGVFPQRREEQGMEYSTSEVSVEDRDEESAPSRSCRCCVNLGVLGKAATLVSHLIYPATTTKITQTPFYPSIPLDPVIAR